MPYEGLRISLDKLSADVFFEQKKHFSLRIYLSIYLSLYLDSCVRACVRLPRTRTHASSSIMK